MSIDMEIKKPLPEMLIATDERTCGMKIYQTKTQADYDALMVKLEGEGCKWMQGENPTGKDYWGKYKELTCVLVDEDELFYNRLPFYAREYHTPIIPFTTEDNVNHPSHYTQGDIEVIDFIQDQLTAEEFRGYCKGNALKYIPREAHKGGTEDLKKARWYLDRAIENLDK